MLPVEKRLGAACDVDKLILHHIKAIISELSDAAVLVGAERQVLRGRCGVLECIQEVASLLY